MSGPKRSAVLCLFRLKYYMRTSPDGGPSTLRRAKIDPRGVRLSCGHFVPIDKARKNYARNLWDCHNCAQQVADVAPLILQAVRRREAARHAAHQCPATCPRCFESEQG